MRLKIRKRCPKVATEVLFEIEMNISQELMPNFRGKTLKEVVKEANKIGVIVEPYGFSGKVVWQSTPVGSDIIKNPICKIKLESS